MTDANDTNDTVSIIEPVEPVEKKVDLKAEVAKVTVEKNATVETVKTPEIIESSVVKEVEKVKEDVVTPEEKSEEPAASKISTITINPTRGMLWYGFINVDTKKKKEFMKQVSTPFDIKDGRWLLVTGHGFLDIASEVKTVEVSDSHKHYFYIDSSEIREVSKEEFRALNDGHGWI